MSRTKLRRVLMGFLLPLAFFSVLSVSCSQEDLLKLLGYELSDFGTFGPEGGRVCSKSGFCIDLPPGATQQNVTIQARKSRVKSPSGVGQVVEYEAPTETFDKDIVVRLPVPEAYRGKGFAVGYRKRENGQTFWESVPTKEVEGGAFLEGSTNHLSLWSIVCPERGLFCTKQKRCIKTQTDAKNCGSCGKICPNGQGCVKGQCQLKCSGSKISCHGKCVDVKSDPEHCGGCKRSCKLSEVCTSGQCKAGCEKNQQECNGRCADLQTSTENCGQCGIRCTKEQACRGGKCVPLCPSNYTICSGSCFNTQNDPRHCGACGHACPVGWSCQKGLCNCASGLQRCGATCADTYRDGKHCGGCGKACPKGRSCFRGSCTRCDLGSNCDGSCVQLQTDAKHCGGCGTACPKGGFCQNGTCACRPGQRVCNSPQGKVCIPNTACCSYKDCRGRRDCVKGSCQCPRYEASCGGFCRNLQTDNAHCGSCGNACKGLRLCRQGICRCPTGTTSCKDGCKRLQTDAKNCGSCDNVCAKGLVCQAGSCLCPAGSRLCNGRCITGSTCCVNSDCRGGRACISGRCLCSKGQTDCSGSCVNTDSDSNHCGGCGKKCASGTVCQKGICSKSKCAQGQKDCHGKCIPQAQCCRSADCPQGKICTSGVCKCPTTQKDCKGTCIPKSYCCIQIDCAKGQICQSYTCRCPAGTKSCNGTCIKVTECCVDAQCQGGKTCQNRKCVCPAGRIDCNGSCADLKNDNKHCGKCSNACSLSEKCTTGICKGIPCGTNQKLCHRVCIPSQNCCSNADCFGGKSCNSGRCSCPKGKKDCNGICRDCCSNSDCTQGQSCIAGSCACPVGQRACQGKCVDNASCCADSDCQGGKTCQSNSCTCPKGKKDCNGICIPDHFCCSDKNCPTGQRCLKGACTCPTGQKLCNGKCIQQNQCCKDADCSGGQTCQTGVCKCPSHQKACNGKCQQCCTNTDCSGGKLCASGSCKCPSGLTDCGGVCRDLTKDNNHCGKCGNKCVSGKVCINSFCTPTAQEGARCNPQGTPGSRIVCDPTKKNLACVPFDQAKTVQRCHFKCGKGLSACASGRACFVGHCHDITCKSNADCLWSNYECRSAPTPTTQFCVPPTPAGPKKFGELCKDPAQTHGCKIGLSCEKATQQSTSGYCTADCTSNAKVCVKEPGGKQSVCQSVGQSGTKLCVFPCRLDKDCPTSFSCKTIGGSQVCLP